MGWLGDWANRYELTIDGDRIDGDLTNFPALITLASGSGLTNLDTTDVFTELVETSTSETTWNPDDKVAAVLLLNGNLTASGTADSWDAVRSTDSKTDGKWYWEVTVHDIPAGTILIGIGTSSETLTYPGDTSQGRGYYNLNGNIYHSTNIAYGDSYLAGDVIGVALDLDVGKMWWSKNGVWQDSGNPVIGANPAYANVFGTFFAMIGLRKPGQSMTANFGTTSFQYTTPSGFLPYVTNYVDNSKKIAVTDHTGVNLLSVEIAHWNWPSEEAGLWAKVPTLTSGTDATLYLYYDSNQPDNDLYVGDIGDTPATDVWDSDYKAVWHFSYQPSALIDSTSNFRHGTAVPNLDATNVVDATTWSFNGTNDYVGVPYHADLQPADAITVEVVASVGAWDIGNQILVSNSQTGGYRLSDDSAGYHVGDLGVLLYIDGDYRVASIPDAGLHNDFYYIAFSFDGQYLKLALDDSIVDTYDHGTPSTISYTYSNSLIIAEEAGTSSAPVGDNVAGDIKEVRISDITRSEAWLKATNYTVLDNFMTFADGGSQPSYYYHGYITEREVPVERIVRLYNRDAGSLMDETTSSGDGYYYLTTTASGEHFVVAFDDEAGEDFNAVIADKLQPLGIE